MERLDQPDPKVITSDDRTFGMMTHLAALVGWVIPFGSIIGPLVAWSIKKHESEFVNENGKAALNFHITWTIVLAVLWVLWIIQFLGSFPLLMMMEGNIEVDEEFPVKLILVSFIYFIPIGFIALFKFVMIIIGTINASNGNVYRYPATYRFIK